MFDSGTAVPAVQGDGASPRLSAAEALATAAGGRVGFDAGESETRLVFAVPAARAAG